MLLQDILYSLRRLWHSKSFALVAILCLGFGIGLNTTIFTVMDGVLLKPYPYTDPDQLRFLREHNPKTDQVTSLSYLDLRDWQDANTVFSTMSAAATRSVTLADGGRDPDRFTGAAISWDLFPLLGTAPILGNGFTAADDKPGAPGVALIGYDVWMNRYQGDKAVVGRSVLINGKPTTIVGVMPQNFKFPRFHDIWLPLAPVVSQDPRNARGLEVYARLKPGVSQKQAVQQMNSIAGKIAEANPATNQSWTGVRVLSLREVFLPPDVPPVIYMMMGGATLVLFIACSNVANLLLARASARRREISVRTALGAGRKRIISQLLTESVVLSVVSVPLGLALASFGTKLIASGMPPGQVPYYVTWDLDWRSIAYSVAVAVSTALFFGLFPALQVSRGNLHESLKEGTRGNSANRSRLRSTLVVVQVTLALVALVGALMFVRTFTNLNGAEMGFDAKPLMGMRYFMIGPPYDPPDAKLQRVKDVIGRIERIPGVEAVFSSNMVPLSNGGGGMNIVVDGRPPAPANESGITFVGVTPKFSRTMGVTVRGRDFSEADGWTQTPVAIVNETMAKRFWQGSDAVGGRFRQHENAQATWFTVIGVMPDLNLYGIDPESPAIDPTAFVSYAYQQTPNTGITVRVAAGAPEAITNPVREALKASDPNLAMFQARSIDEGRRLTFWQFGLFGWIFGSIGAMALLLAAVGVYGVLSYNVEQRTQEIGVRVALGAGRRSVLGLVVGHGLLLAGIGVVLGLIASPFAMQAAQTNNLLYNVSRFDPFILGGVALFLMTTAFLASVLPALRATRVDPIVALRGE